MFCTVQSLFPQMFVDVVDILMKLNEIRLKEKLVHNYLHVNGVEAFSQRNNQITLS